MVEQLVVRRTRVVVVKDDRHGSACRVPVIDSAEGLGLIGLYAGSRPLCPALAAKDVSGEILRRQRDAGAHAINDGPDSRTMGFSEYAYTEFSAESVHNAL